MCTNEPVTREQEYSRATLLKKITRTYQHFAPYKLITSFEPSFCSGNWGYVNEQAIVMITHMFVMLRNDFVTNRSYTHVMHAFVTNICTRHVQTLQLCIVGGDDMRWQYSPSWHRSAMPMVRRCSAMLAPWIVSTTHVQFDVHGLATLVSLNTLEKVTGS